MNEQLQQSLVEILTKATQSVQDGIGFLSGQLPDVIHQLLMWNMIESCFFVFLSLTVFVVMSTISYKCLKNAQKANEFEDGDWYFAAGISGIIAALEAVPLICNLLVVIQIWIAPKVWLLNYIRHIH